MNSQIFTEKLQGIMEEMKEISHMDYFLFSEEGDLEAWTKDVDIPELGKMVREFRDSPAERQIARGFFFVRICVWGKTEYILLAETEGTDEHSYTIVQMAASQIRNLYLMANSPMDENQYLRQLLLGNLSDEEMEEEAKKLKLDQNPRSMFVLEFEEEKNEIAMETLRNLFLQDDREYLLDMNSHRAVLIKSAQHQPEEASEELAHMIIDNLQTEALANVKVGYGRNISTYQQMEQNYKDICTALKISRIFYPKRQVAVYEHLGIGRLIYQLPKDLCQMFLREVFSGEEEVELDKEMLVTIDKLFENNLNISETARQLYVHRNTLVYRLERIEKILGLDIRTFEDAMMFRIAMMVQAHVKYLEKKESRNIVKRSAQ